MEIQEQQDSSVEDINDSENTENMLGNVKNFLFLIGGVIVVLGILVLMPMVLTYFSNGSLRP